MAFSVPCYVLNLQHVLYCLKDISLGCFFSLKGTEERRFSVAFFLCP